MNMFGGGFKIFGLLFGLIFFLLVIAIVVVVIIYIVRSQSRQTSMPSRKNEALEIAKTRYAKGEISKEEYEALVKELQR